MKNIKKYNQLKNQAYRKYKRISQIYCPLVLSLLSMAGKLKLLLKKLAEESHFSGALSPTGPPARNGTRGGVTLITQEI